MGKHRSAEERSKLVNRYRRSGLTRREFCEREGVSRSTLSNWLHAYEAEAEVRFVELATKTGRQETASLELRLGDVCLVLPAALSDERIAQLVVTIECSARRSR